MQQGAQRFLRLYGGSGPRALCEARNAVTRASPSPQRPCPQSGRAAQCAPPAASDAANCRQFAPGSPRGERSRRVLRVALAARGISRRSIPQGPQAWPAGSGSCRCKVARAPRGLALLRRSVPDLPSRRRRGSREARTRPGPGKACGYGTRASSSPTTRHAARGCRPRPSRAEAGAHTREPALDRRTCCGNANRKPQSCQHSASADCSVFSGKKTQTGSRF